MILDVLKKRFGRQGQPQTPSEPAGSLDAWFNTPEAASEPLVPEPEWEGSQTAPERRWQRPVLFLLAGLLSAGAAGYTLTNDWWLARQSRTLDAGVERTARSLRTRAVEKTAALQDGIEQLLTPAPVSRPPLTPLPPPAAVVPPPPQAVSLPPVLRRLPPLPPIAPPRPIPVAAPAPSAPPPAKIVLLGGNERVVLLEIAGERVQLAPGQTGPAEVTVISAESLPGSYRVRLRRGDGAIEEKSLVTSAPPPDAPTQLSDSPESESVTALTEPPSALP